MKESCISIEEIVAYYLENYVYIFFTRIMEQCTQECEREVAIQLFKNCTTKTQNECAPEIEACYPGHESNIETIKKILAFINRVCNGNWQPEDILIKSFVGTNEETSSPEFLSKLTATFKNGIDNFIKTNSYNLHLILYHHATFLEPSRE